MLDDIKIYGNKGSRLNDIKSLNILTPAFGIIKSNEINNYSFDNLYRIISQIERETKCQFGINLRVSARSSSQYIMPGIMTTILNISTYDELDNAIKTIIQSANSEKCLWYKKTFGLDDDMPFAIIIQQMVYGNKNEYNSGSGVFTTRNPITGISNMPYGEFSYGVVGEQIVGGIYTPTQICKNSKSSITTLEEALPSCYQLLLQYGQILEKYYKCVQEIEFTIENGILYVLQTRDAIISSGAIKQVLLDLVDDNVISFNDAIDQLKKYNIQLNDFSKSTNIIDDNTHIAQGIVSSTGIAIGKILIYNDNIDIYKLKEPTILIAKDTTPNMLPLLQQCVGCLTKYGGSLCHASIVCRALHIPAITGCKDIKFIQNNKIQINNYIFTNGDYISLNCNTGFIYKGIKNI